ncbi:MAG: agmatine deiminase family protein [Chitinophagaceae bacterium]|nr:agmatine deiminase family protein [Chitinophagaceae bacterium]
MKQLSFILLTIIFVLSCTSNKQERPAETFYMPAEWEQNDAVWLNWNGGGIHCSTQQQPKKKR